jgi:hypothetical protein
MNTSVAHSNYWHIQPAVKWLAARHAPAGLVILSQGGITQRMAALRLARREASCGSTATLGLLERTCHSLRTPPCIAATGCL